MEVLSVEPSSTTIILVIGVVCKKTERNARGRISVRLWVGMMTEILFMASCFCWAVTRKCNRWADFRA